MITKPAGSPPYPTIASPSTMLPEWIAWVIVKRIPSSSTVPPVLNPTTFTPLPPKCTASSYFASTGQPCLAWTASTSAM